MTMKRASAFSPPDIFNLRMWGRALFEAFDAMPYHVGSSLTGTEYRDVDIRVILEDDDPLLKPPLITAVNVAFSIWGQHVTGLPIDFQLQSMTEANKEPMPGRRNPIGMDGRRDRWAKNIDAQDGA